MPMSKAQVRIYNQHFEMELAAMSVSECRRWNPHLTDEEAEYMIAKAKTACAKREGGGSKQSSLF